MSRLRHAQRQESRRRHTAVETWHLFDRTDSLRCIARQHRLSLHNGDGKERKIVEPIKPLDIEGKRNGSK